MTTKSDVLDDGADEEHGEAGTLSKPAQQNRAVPDTGHQPDRGTSGNAGKSGTGKTGQPSHSDHPGQPGPMKPGQPGSAQPLKPGVPGIHDPVQGARTGNSGKGTSASSGGGMKTESDRLASAKGGPAGHAVQPTHANEKQGQAEMAHTSHAAPAKGGSTESCENPAKSAGDKHAKSDDGSCCTGDRSATDKSNAASHEQHAHGSGEKHVQPASAQPSKTDQSPATKSGKSGQSEHAGHSHDDAQHSGMKPAQPTQHGGTPGKSTSADSTKPADSARKGSDKDADSTGTKPAKGTTGNR